LRFYSSHYIRLGYDKKLKLLLMLSIENTPNLNSSLKNGNKI